MIKIKDNNLMQICTYNKKYLIAVSETGFILIIDYELKKIINFYMLPTKYFKGKIII